jgi:hypothetical protein
MLWLNQKLSPEEKKKVRFLLKNVQILSRKINTTGFQRLVMKKQAERILQLLGDKTPNVQRRIDAISIIRDKWPFKIWRIKNLIYGLR